MSKLAIVTLYKKNRNYGGLLQAHAMQKLFSEGSAEAELISYIPQKNNYIYSRIRNLGVCKTLKIAAHKIQTKLYMVMHRDVRRKIQIRNKKFEAFEQSIPHSRDYTDATIEECKDKYDIFVCGSDQVWNPALWNDVYFLAFAPRHSIKVSYGASIARERLTPAEIRYMQQRLKSYTVISVRESNAKNLVEALTDRSVQVVLDPTLMLNQTYWTQYAQRPKACPKEYVFSFFLGQDNKNIMRSIYEECRKKEIVVVTIPHLQTGYKKSDIQYSDLQLYDVGVSEWLYLMEHANYIFTDSFHGVAFSINFNKQFSCFGKNKEGDRYSENSRLNSLLSMLDLTTQMQNENIICNHIDYDKVNDKLERLREQSYDFIRGVKGEYSQR